MNKWSIKLSLNLFWDDVVFCDLIGSFRIVCSLEKSPLFCPSVQVQCSQVALNFLHADYCSIYCLGTLVISSPEAQTSSHIYHLPKFPTRLCLDCFLWELNKRRKWDYSKAKRNLTRLMCLTRQWQKCVLVLIVSSLKKKVKLIQSIEKRSLVWKPSQRTI